MNMKRGVSNFLKSFHVLLALKKKNFFYLTGQILANKF